MDLKSMERYASAKEVLINSPAGRRDCFNPRLIGALSLIDSAVDEHVPEVGQEQTKSPIERFDGLWEEVDSMEGAVNEKSAIDSEKIVVREIISETGVRVKVLITASEYNGLTRIPNRTISAQWFSNDKKMGSEPAESTNNLGLKHSPDDTELQRQLTLVEQSAHEAKQMAELPTTVVL